MNPLSKNQPSSRFQKNIQAQTPLVQVVLITVGIFVGEIIVMISLQALPQFPIAVKVLIDAVLLVILLSTMLYFFPFRPKLNLVRLFHTHERLHSEMAERKAVEATLRESEARLRFLSSQLLKVQEKERKRISDELHEEFGVTLVSLKLGLRFIARSLREDQADLKNECEENIENVLVLIENIRRLSRELSPSPLEDIGLTAALRRLISALARDRELNHSLELGNLDLLFPNDVQVHVYRIFQEAVGNIERYSDVTRVSLIANRKDDEMSFVLEHDGQDFEPGHGYRRVGLTTMLERARMAGGSLEMSKGESGGTQLILAVPLASATNHRDESTHPETMAPQYLEARAQEPGASPNP